MVSLSWAIKVFVEQNNTNAGTPVQKILLGGQIIKAHYFLDQGKRGNHNDEKDEEVQMHQNIGSVHTLGYSGFSHDDLMSNEKRTSSRLKNLSSGAKRIVRGMKLKNTLDQIRVMLDNYWQDDIPKLLKSAGLSFDITRNTISGKNNEGKVIEYDFYGARPAFPMSLFPTTPFEWRNDEWSKMFNLLGKPIDKPVEVEIVRSFNDSIQNRRTERLNRKAAATSTPSSKKENKENAKGKLLKKSRQNNSSSDSSSSSDDDLFGLKTESVSNKTIVESDSDGEEQKTKDVRGELMQTAAGG